MPRTIIKQRVAREIFSACSPHWLKGSVIINGPMFRFVYFSAACSSANAAGLAGFALFAFMALPLGCSEAVQVGRNFGAAGSAPAAVGGAPPELFVDGAAGGAPLTPAPPAPAAECVEARCGSVLLACGNCEDDDQDGLADAADPECLGPCDDSEAELFTGAAPRVNGSCRTDCFFDRNVGAGDDGCSWSYRCDPESVAPGYAPTGLERCAYDEAASICELTPAQAGACQEGCLPLTPNGCDCFGCCELPAGAGQFVWLGSESLDLAHCELQTSGDPELCRPCTPVPDCQNDCAECELCVGKSALPSSCGAGMPQCPGGQRACDPASANDCGAFEYCITGCCVALPR